MLRNDSTIMNLLHGLVARRRRWCCTELN